MRKKIWTAVLYRYIYIYDVLPEFYSWECNELMSAILDLMTMLLLIIFIGFHPSPDKKCVWRLVKYVNSVPFCDLQFHVAVQLIYGRSPQFVRQLKRTGNSILNLLLFNRLTIVQPSINNFRVHMIPQSTKNRGI